MAEKAEKTTNPSTSKGDGDSNVDKDPSVAFAKVYHKAKSLGLTGKELSKLKSLECLEIPRSGLSWKTAIFFSFVALVIGLLLRQYSVEHVLQGMVANDEECLLEPGSPFLGDAFRPVKSCDVCRGLTKVKRVSNITPEEFEEKYAYSGVPVVIVDGTKNWTAPDVFSFNYFKELYAPGSTALQNAETKCHFFPYKTSFGSLSEMFSMSESRAKMEEGTEPWYVGWSNCDATAAAELRKHYNRPYFLPRVAESSRTDWIFMGSSGYGAPMHVDNVGYPSWQAQITGQKMWILRPPLECFYQCQAELKVTINPGEIIVLDTNTWYHSTLIVSKEMSITIGSEFD